MSLPTLPSDIAAVVEELVATRRDLHAHPELGFAETRTAAIVAGRLKSLGLEPRTGVGGTGVTALLEGSAGRGPTILLRADMDALPVTESADVPFRSQTPGVMHACGHDAHTAILLAAADVLMGRRERLKGRLKLCFQPAEEMVGGAERMIADGVLDDPPVDMAFGLHVWSGLDTGQASVGAGPIMASADWFTITVHGRGGHAAVPEATVDPVLTAAHIIVAAQGIVSRNVSPTQPAVLSITQVHGGEAPNVTPETVVLGGTVRAFDPRVRALMRRRLEEIATHTAQAHGARAEVEYREGCPPAVNDAAAAALVSEACSSVLGADQVSVWAPQTVGEDFACFLERVPGCFYFLGMRDETAGSVWPHHHPRFTVDERALPLGVATFVALAERVLG